MKNFERETRAHNREFNQRLMGGGGGGSGSRNGSVEGNETSRLSNKAFKSHLPFLK